MSLQWHRRAVASVVAALLTLAGGAVSASETVGRIAFELPSPEWRTLAAYEHALRYQSGERIPLFTKIYGLPGGGPAPKAMLLVTSTDGSYPGGTRWVTELCPEARPRFHTADFGTNRLTRVRECIVVNPAFAAATYFRSADAVLGALREQGLALPSNVSSLRSTAGSESGSLVSIHLVAPRTFVGSRGSAPEATDTHDVAPELVAWAESLHRAVRSAAIRPGGRLVLPPIAFEEP